MIITRHRTIYGRLRAHGRQVAETMASFAENPLSSRPDAERYANRNVIEHFGRKRRDEIEQEMDILLDAADDGDGRMRTIINKKQGQWWEEALRQADKLPAPDISDVASYRRYVEIDAFRLQKVQSTLYARHVLGITGKVDRSDLENEVSMLPSDHPIFTGRMQSFGVIDITLTESKRFEFRGDVFRMNGNFPESIVASLPGREFEEIADMPFLRGSGIRILEAEHANGVLELRTDAHDEDNTITYVPHESKTGDRPT